MDERKNKQIMYLEWSLFYPEYAPYFYGLSSSEQLLFNFMSLFYSEIRGCFFPPGIFFKGLCFLAIHGLQET